MRYGAEHKSETRLRVLTEAANAIRTQGPQKVGVAEVMAKAGLTHGGFYAHFSSRDDLVAAAIDKMFEDSRERLARYGLGRTPAQGLAAYIDFYLSPAHRDTRTTGCPLPFLAADAPRLEGVARERFAAGVQYLNETLARSLQQIGRPDADAEAGSMLAELVGALSLARAEPDQARSEAILTRSRTALKTRFGLEAVS